MAAESGALDSKVDFNRDIRPILSDNCYTCHGPDEKKRQFELRLDTPDGPYQERSLGGPVIVPGDAAASMLYKRVSSTNPGWKMPPAGSERELSDGQIALLRDWIDQGAPWAGHWAFQPPDRPIPPRVSHADELHNPIDSFVLDRLEKLGTDFSPQADRTTLIRRVTYDLTGLPPTLEEVDAFLSDASPDAYEKVVDRLLASPRYGERMAVTWLDAARYADTHGYHIDSHRDMWLWRDWVIDAFNRNLPFDEFTIEQLAGDLLPNPSEEQLVATGFNRNHMINFEGGAIPEEYLNEYIVDRVNTTSTVWLGVTMACAQCHDHKYDPISQKDYYRFYAYFNNIQETGLDGRLGNARPFLRVPHQDQRIHEEELEKLIAELKKQLPEEEVSELRETWEQTALSSLHTPSANGLLAHYEFDDHLADTSGNYKHGRSSSEKIEHQKGRVADSLLVDGEISVDLGDAAPLRADRPFTLATWILPGGNAAGYILSRRDPANEEQGFGIFFGDEAVPRPGVLATPFSFRLIHRWPDESISISRPEPLPNGQWLHLAIIYDGSMKASGLKVFINGELQEMTVDSDQLTGPIATDSHLYLGVNTDFPFAKKRRGTTALIDDLRFYDRQLDSTELLLLRDDAPVRATLLAGSKDRKEPQTREITDYFLSHAAPGPMRKAHADLETAQQQLRTLQSEMPTTMVMRELEEPRKTFLLERGDYRNQREEVQPAVPGCLPPMPDAFPNNRLGLARWLVSGSNPLTARVTVNRFWQVYFGQGLVSTSEDFGSQGSPPSHPQLLDWLAREFVESGWDIKRMQKLIVTSTTYRQASKRPSWAAENDPENRWLSYNRRLRLPAEMIRDGALSMAGLLNPQIGGPSVFPYQPPKLWREMSFGEQFTAQEYKQDSGSSLYRRSLYTFWKRTVPPPEMSTFDAPDRESCTVRRSRTNTPLQPLVLLNDTTFVEAARGLATRVLKESELAPEQRITLAFRLATARLPKPAETRLLMNALQAQQAFYAERPEEAKKLVSVGESSLSESINAAELASWTVLASSLLNLDETITRE